MNAEMNMASKFWESIGADKLRKAHSTEGGLYISPGTYLLEIQRCKMIETLAQEKAFIAEFKVIESDNPVLQAGAEPSYFVNMEGKYPDLSLGNVTDFMRAGLAAAALEEGVEAPPAAETVIDPEIATSITGESNVLAGVKIECYAFNKPTKAGKDFTRFKWRVPAA